MHPLEVGLPGERDERRAVEVGVADRRDEVHRAGAQRAEADAGAAGEAAVHVGHVGAALLVADGDERTDELSASDALRSSVSSPGMPKT